MWASCTLGHFGSPEPAFLYRHSWAWQACPPSQQLGHKTNGILPASHWQSPRGAGIAQAVLSAGLAQLHLHGEAEAPIFSQVI